MLEYIRRWVRVAPGGVHALFYQYGAGAMIRPLSSDFRIMYREGVRGVIMFSENCQYREHCQDQTPDLRGYLCARLAWDPEFDVEKGIREFCDAYYGEAAPAMIWYVHEINNLETYAGKSRISPKDLQSRPGFHSMGHCDPIRVEKLREMDPVFDQIEGDLANDPVSLRRVRQDRLPLQFNILMYLPKEDPLYKKAAKGFFSTYDDLKLRVEIKINNERSDKSQTLEEFRAEVLGR
jgi:hypothetical protein